MYLLVSTCRLENTELGCGESEKCADTCIDVTFDKCMQLIEFVSLCFREQKAVKRFMKLAEAKICLLLSAHIWVLILWQEAHLILHESFASLQSAPFAEANLRSGIFVAGFVLLQRLAHLLKHLR